MFEAIKKLFFIELNIFGGFLAFDGVKVWCGEQGVTDFGPYGGLLVRSREKKWRVERRGGGTLNFF